MQYSVRRQAIVALNEIKFFAFKKHVSEFLHDIPDLKISNVDNYVGHMADDYVGLDGNLEVSLYRVLINSLYGNTFVSTLYNKLGAEYVKALGNAGEVNREITDEAELKVVVETIVDHFLTKLSSVE